MTIVTVVKNGAERLQKTIDSIAAQDYDNIEYIIKDGLSDDGTMDVIKNVAKKYPFIKFVSAADKGIYDAMNQAMRLVTGDYVNFLNAGDYYTSDFVISRVALAAKESKAVALYGDIVYVHTSGKTELRRYGRLCAKKIYYLTGDCINHQALFTATKLLRREHFDTSYEICADREWMLKIGLYDSRMKMKTLGFPVTYYPLDGVSVVNKAQYNAEAARCIKTYMPAGYPFFQAFEFFRNNEFLKGILHGVYKVLFIRKDRTL